MITALLKLIPRGLAWLLPGEYLRELTEALAIEPGRIADFLEGVVRESNPGTAVDTQPEWYQTYGLAFDSTKTLQTQQAETLERYVALGGQDIAYVQGQVDRAGFEGVELVETGPTPGSSEAECGAAECGAAECWDVPDYIPDPENWLFYYLVQGDVPTGSELLRLKALLQRIAPGHCIPVFSVIVSNNVCGSAECGEAFCDG